MLIDATSKFLDRWASTVACAMAEHGKTEAANRMAGLSEHESRMVRLKAYQIIQRKK